MWKCASTNGGVSSWPSASTLSAGRRVEPGRHLGDAAACHGDRHAGAAVGQGGVGDEQVEHQRSPFAVRLHQRLRIRRLARDQHQRQDRQHDRAASGRAGRAARPSPDCCRRNCSASKKANSSAPSSALPGRHDANTTSATQIQPRPLIMLKKKALKADSVRKRAGHAHQRRAGDDRAGAHGGDRDALALGRLRVLADHAHREAERRAVERLGDHRHQQQREQGQRRLRVEDRHAAASPSRRTASTVGGVLTFGKLTR